RTDDLFRLHVLSVAGAREISAALARRAPQSCRLRERGISQRARPAVSAPAGGPGAHRARALQHPLHHAWAAPVPSESADLGFAGDLIAGATSKDLAYRRGVMKLSIFGCVAMVCAATALAGQTPTNPSSASTTQANQTITLSGCVGGGASATDPVTLSNVS